MSRTPLSPDYGNDLANIFQMANRGLSRTIPPRPDPASAGAPCGADRFVLAGGFLNQLLMHPTFVPFETLFRKLPETGMFTASPERNFQFELGSFEVPLGMCFAFVDYRFMVFRPNGAVAGDTVPIESERLSTLLGFDVTIDKYRKGNLRYELDPTPIQTSEEAFAPQVSGGVIAQGNQGTNTGTGSVGTVTSVAAEKFGIPQFAPSSGPSMPTQAQFALANFTRSAAPSSAGLSLLPQRPERQGPLPLPFTYYVKEKQRVQFECVIFKPIPIPIAFFEVDVTGILMPANVLEDMLAGMRPCYAPDGGR